MRKTEHVTINDEMSRDHGKVFLVREMSAAQTERWAARAVLALTRSGVDIPEDIASAGLAGLMTMGLKAFAGAKFDEVEPLMDEMMGCVKIIRDPSAIDHMTGEPLAHPIITENDIEEFTTRLKLRAAIINLHFGFFLTGKRSTTIQPGNSSGTTMAGTTSAQGTSHGASPPP